MLSTALSPCKRLADNRGACKLGEEVCALSPKRRSVPGALQDVPSLLSRFHYTPDASKLVFVMVGLPARGKSFLSMRLARFLEWTGTSTRVFNVGKHRRATETGVQDAAYFDPQDVDAVARREELAMDVLQEMIDWLKDGKERFAIFDATNTTKARRHTVAMRMWDEDRNIGVIFVESLCNDPAVLEANVTLKLSKSPDYASIPREQARKDLLSRLSNYEMVYEPIDEEMLNLGGEVVPMSFIKVRNFSSHVVAHNIWGRAAMTVLPFVMAIHVGSRPLWLVRLPHSADSAQAWRRAREWPAPAHIRFSEQTLSPRGTAFADLLIAFLQREAPDLVPFSCTHRRGIDIAERLGNQRVRVALNPQERGECNGLSAKQIAAHAPEVWADPMNTRFSGGENLRDVLQRLIPTLIEIEQEMRPVAVIAPLSVLQIIYCHYSAQPVSGALTVEIPLHTVVEIRPDGGNFKFRNLSAEDLECLSIGFQP